jgi:hypothetical protein
MKIMGRRIGDSRSWNKPSTADRDHMEGVPGRSQRRMGRPSSRTRTEAVLGLWLPDAARAKGAAAVRRRRAARLPRRWEADEPAPETGMCRNIKALFNFAPPATEEEVRAAALQFVRKISGFNQPSLANEAAFSRAVDEVAAAAESLMGSLVTNAQARDREVEAQKARERGRVRFAARG